MTFSIDALSFLFGMKSVNVQFYKLQHCAAQYGPPTLRNCFPYFRLHLLVWNSLKWLKVYIYADLLLFSFDSISRHVYVHPIRCPILLINYFFLCLLTFKNTLSVSPSYRGINIHTYIIFLTTSVDNLFRKKIWNIRQLPISNQNNYMAGVVYLYIEPGAQLWGARFARGRQILLGSPLFCAFA